VNEPTELELRRDQIEWTVGFWFRWLVEHRDEEPTSSTAQLGEILIRADPDYWFTHSMRHLYEETQK
jgi:hypothetical protein